MITGTSLLIEVLLMKIKGLFKENHPDTKTEQVQHEFNIRKFHLNSKLRFPILMEEPIKLFQKRE
jgi:hypothetical protein